MDTERRNSKMEMFMMVSLFWDKKTEMESKYFIMLDFIIMMETTMKVVGKMVMFMDLENKFGKMEEFMRDNLKITNQKEKEF